MGEIRDRETMEHAMAFAETGHLVHGHAARQQRQPGDWTASSTSSRRAPRPAADGPVAEPEGMISQRLLPREDGKGRSPRWNAQHAADFRPDLQGRSGEIKEIMKKSRELGMQTFDQALFDLTSSNEISYEDACATPIRSTTCACRSSSTASARSARTWPRAPSTSPSYPPAGTAAKLNGGLDDPKAFDGPR